MSLRDRLPQTLQQEAARGLALAFGVVTVGVWGLLGYGWYLGPTHHLQRTAIGHVPPPALEPVRQAAAPVAPVAQPAVTTPIVAQPAAPAPAPENETPIKRLPQSHSLLVANAGQPAQPAPAAPAAQDANARQVAADAGLEEAGDVPAAASAPETAAKPAPEPVGKPVPAKLEAQVAMAPVFPVAAPVVHPRYVSVYSRRLHRRRWVLVAARPVTGMLSGEERPAHDLTAAAPLDPNMRAPVAPPVQLAAAPQPTALPLSPGAQAELAASQREERQVTHGVPDAEPPRGGQVALAETQVARASALPRQRLALRRHQLPLSARMAPLPGSLAAHAAARPSVARALPAAPVAGAPRQANAGVTMYAVGGARASVGGARASVGGARVTVGEPVYDAGSRTLRVPLEGRLPDGPLKVYRLDNGRAYVDVAGARPASARTKFVTTQDGAFQRGAIAAHPETGATRMSFDLGRDGDLAARVEGGQVVLRAVPREKKARTRD